MTRTPYSLGRRLAFLLTASLLVVCIVGGTLLYLYVHHRLLDQFDATLRSKAAALATLVHDHGNGELEFHFADEFMPEFQRQKATEYFELWRSDGTLIEKSQTLKTDDLAQFGGSIKHPEMRELQFRDGHKLRAAGVVFHPQLDVDEGFAQDDDPESEASKQTVTLVIARDLHGLHEALEPFVTGLIAFMFLLPICTALVVWVIINRSLAPVNSLARKAAAINPDALDTRFYLEDMPSELHPIVRGLNQLLAKIGNAFERERRFTTDVSHELRTPVAEAMNALTMAVEWPDDSRLLVKACRSSVDSLRRVQSLIDTLLNLARSDAATIESRMHECNLVPLITRVVSGFEQAAAGRNIEILCSAPEVAKVHTSEELLTLVLHNLLGNAIVYSPPGSRVLLTLSLDKAVAVISIANPAPNLKPGDLPHLTEAFWRHSESRSDTSHFGLGLTITSSICQRLNIKLQQQLHEGSLLMKLNIPDPTINQNNDTTRLS